MKLLWIGKNIKLAFNLIANDTTKVTAKSKNHLSLFLSSLIAFYNCRLEKTLLILENHMPLFKSICNHTDVPEAIITYVNYYRINIYKPNRITGNISVIVKIFH